MRTTERHLAIGLGLALGAGLGGCAGTVASRSSVQPVESGRSEALFLSSEVAEASGGDGWEYSRRDGEMALASNQLPTASDQWTADTRPTLERRRSVQLQSGSFGDSVIFFLPERAYSGPERRHWHR